MSNNHHENYEMGGEELLLNLHRLPKPLSDLELSKVAKHLNASQPTNASEGSIQESYNSQDLMIGQLRREKPSPTPAEFQESLDRPAMEQFDENVQDLAFEFILSDARIEKMLDRSQSWIQIKGAERKFYHYQIYAAFWLIMTERGPRRGAIEADGMGIGKTTEAYLYIYFNILLMLNAQDIQQYPERHCQSTRSSLEPQSPNTQCPSQKKWPIACACQEWSVTRRLNLVGRPGASLVFVPASLLGRWEAEWRAMGFKSSLQIRLFVQHRDYPERSIPSHLFNRLILDPDLSMPSPNARKLSLSGQSDAHLFVVLTTVESYYSQIQDYFGSKWQWRSSQIGKPPQKADFTDGLAWARVLRDEAHLSPNWSTNIYRIIESVVHNGWVSPNLLILTATPILRNGLGDVEASIRAINLVSPGLHVHKDYKVFAASGRLESLVVASKALQKLCGTESRRRSELVEQVGRLLAAYCIRRQSCSMQNGKRLVWIPPLECYDVTCPHPRKAALLVSEVENVLKKRLTTEWTDYVEGTNMSEGCKMDIFLDNALLSRVFASAPGLARYQNCARLRWKTIKDELWHEEPERCPFYKDWETLEAYSGKFQCLKKILSLLSSCRAADNLPEKLVIVSEFPIICLLALCLCRRMRFTSAWMHADLNATERELMTKAFQDRCPRLRDLLVLIGTPQILGQGLTLNRAHRLVLMEPNIHVGVEAQVGDRVHRLGSQTDRCWVYRLTNPDSRVEKLLIEHQEGQKDFQRVVEWFREPASSDMDLEDDVVMLVE